MKVRIDSDEFYPVYCLYTGPGSWEVDLPAPLVRKLGRVMQQFREVQSDVRRIIQKD